MGPTQTDITVLDFESCGAVPGYADEPWQLGLVVLRAGVLAPETCWESLLRVGERPISPYAPGKHHQLRAELAAAPPPQSLWPTLKPLLCGRPLAAHATATEKRLLRGIAPLHRFGPWIDTLVLARCAWPGLPSYALGDLLRRLALEPRVRALCPGRVEHDALYDAVAAAVLLERLLAEPAWRQLSLSDLAALRPARKPAHP